MINMRGAGSWLGTKLPIVGAPMAGGATTTALVRAVGSAGGIGFVPAGYKSAAALENEMAELNRAGIPFGVNLFVPKPSALETADYKRYARALQPEADRFDLRLSDIPLTEDDDDWPAKIGLLVANPVPLVSLTFALPPRSDLRALQKVGSRVLMTVTSLAEARAAADLGVDGLVVQGAQAGGHSGIHDPHGPLVAITTEELVRTIATDMELPVVAGGGVDGPGSVAGLLRAGADAVAVGTLLLRTDESGASTVHKDALADPRFSETVITRAFTGRPARGLRNDFIDSHEAEAPIGYPAIHHLTRGFRQAAARAGDAERVHLWAGTGYRSARTGPAASVIEHLTTDL